VSLIVPGFHQSRYGYKNIDELETVMAKYEAINFPVESIWSDIDHMDAYKDFTLHPEHYPEEKLRSFVQGLHEKDQKFIMIIDPGIDRKNFNFTKSSKLHFRKHASYQGFLWDMQPSPECRFISKFLYSSHTQLR